MEHVRFLLILIILINASQGHAPVWLLESDIFFKATSYSSLLHNFAVLGLTTQWLQFCIGINYVANLLMFWIVWSAVEKVFVSPYFYKYARSITAFTMKWTITRCTGGVATDLVYIDPRFSGSFDELWIEPPVQTIGGGMNTRSHATVSFAYLLLGPGSFDQTGKQTRSLIVSII